MAHSPSSEQRGTFRLAGVHCTGCAGTVECARQDNSPITWVHFDWASDAVHIGYQAGMITPAAIECVMARTSCSRAPAVQGASAAAQPPAQHKLQHRGHGAARQPITLGHQIRPYAV